ncbi:uncharacterized protein METZ01_LOCUS450374, partial [marine metagenome]
MNLLKDQVIMDFNSCGDKKKLKELLENYKKNFPNEDGDTRPKTVLAYFKKYLTFKRDDGRNDPYIKELESYASTLSKTELTTLYQMAPLLMQDFRYESDYTSLVQFFQ